ncbi:MAG: DUF6701 domain-containing protein [Burkholderiaceae bacterium]|nr:DUF6701 domain-containing protein [Burkholderiaceae bacterium]
MSFFRQRYCSFSARSWLLLAACALLLVLPDRVRADSVTASPTDCWSGASLGNSRTWSNAGYVYASDNYRANASVNDNQVTNYLMCTGYGFAIPTDSVINGISVNVERYASDTLIQDYAVRLVKAGVVQNGDRSTTSTYPTSASSEASEAHGGTADLWGTTWTPEEINASNFGAAFAAKKNGTSGGSRTVYVDHIPIVVSYTPPPTVSSIVLANSSPANSGDSVSWTVTFNRSVTGVDASDFSLVTTGTVSGASITSVSGSGTTWTVTANTGSGGTDGGTLGLNLVDDDTIVDANNRKLGGTGTGNGSFTGEVYSVFNACVAPSNVPSGLTCRCDNFNRTTLNPSTIFNSNWIVSSSDSTSILPNITNQGFLRLTNRTQNNAKAATVPGIFPAKGNYISVEFRLYAYNGNSADGIGVTLSDYTVPPVPGAYGGSLGYAQKTGISGFAGGWIGVGLDEFGNYQNPSEGRVGGPGPRAQSVAVRGSGSGTSNYLWLAGTAANLSPTIDSASSPSAAPGHRYQVIVDARDYTDSNRVAWVNVLRDTSGGTSYSSVFSDGAFNAFTSSAQAAVPDNWQISFTGSTGTNYNIHEIGSVRICASTLYPPGGGTASNFNAIDSAYSQVLQNFLNGHIFMKVAGVPFTLSVAALDNNQIVSSYAATGSKTVTVNLVDNSDGVCVIDNNQANYCSNACKAKYPVASQTMTFTSADAGKKQTASFTLGKAYANLVAIISDDLVSACSTDAFSVRPQSFALTTDATNAASSGVPVFKADNNPFSISAIANAGGYSGTPIINNASLTVVNPATNGVAGSISGVFPAATAGTNSSSSTAAFKYSEVGAFQLAANGVYDDSWTRVDSVSAKGDCVTNSFSNALSSDGKYGCNIGTTVATLFGRFIPDHFTLTNSMVTPACETGTFTYMGQPFSRFQFSVEARNGNDKITKNYAGDLAKGTVLLVAENNDAATDLGSRASLPATSWQAGVYSVDTPALSFSRLSVPDGAYDNLRFGIKVSSGETSLAETDKPVLQSMDMNATTTGICGSACDSKALGTTTTSVRFGRLRLTNAYGSQRLPLPIPMRAEYYNGTTFVTNTLDSCTSVVRDNVAMPVYKGAVSSANMTVTGNVTAGGTFVNGIGRLRLAQPNPMVTKKGSVDVCVDLGVDTPETPARCVATTPMSLPWLKGRWTGGDYVDDPKARATFGIYKSSIGRGANMIYIREVY